MATITIPTVGTMYIIPDICTKTGASALEVVRTVTTQGNGQIYTITTLAAVDADGDELDIEYIEVNLDMRDDYIEM